jgi:hypothetical protein
MRDFLSLPAGRAGEWAIRRLRSELSGVGRDDVLVVAQQVARVSGRLDLGRPAVLGLAAVHAAARPGLIA